ncbi:MAG: hypothetical protein J4203_03310 [Candidatus Diapherotrites archaeon]|uniref:Lipoprotein n=1 Tax=Candidatus Iainarchaeum sp. TaxID=3101447 RepID=A0A8T4LHZ9_9ARCH|nr:hypothetical protein [Candidatus Diapherotrites archaeon]
MQKPILVLVLVLAVVLAGCASGTGQAYSADDLPSGKNAAVQLSDKITVSYIDTKNPDYKPWNPEKFRVEVPVGGSLLKYGAYSDVDIDAKIVDDKRMDEDHQYWIRFKVEGSGITLTNSKPFEEFRVKKSVRGTNIKGSVYSNLMDCGKPGTIVVQLIFRNPKKGHEVVLKEIRSGTYYGSNC